MACAGAEREGLVPGPSPAPTRLPADLVTLQPLHKLRGRRPRHLHDLLQLVQVLAKVRNTEWARDGARPPTWSRQVSPQVQGKPPQTQPQVQGRPQSGPRCRIRSLPLKSVFPVIISAMMQPTDQMSSETEAPASGLRGLGIGAPPGAAMSRPGWCCLPPPPRASFPPARGRVRLSDAPGRTRHFSLLCPASPRSQSRRER